MPHLPHSIELHDSDVASVTIVERALVIDFTPAYVHRDGKGWLQNARLVLGAAMVEPFECEFPQTVAAGDITTSDRRHNNLLVLPLDVRGPVSLEFVFGSGAVLRATGESVTLKLLGVAEYVEDVNCQ